MRVLVFLLVAYAASPIDLIPDFIPVLGLLDDVLLLPLGIALALRLTPYEIRVEAMQTAVASRRGPKTCGRWIVATVVVALWIAVIVVLARWAAQRVALFAVLRHAPS